MPWVEGEALTPTNLNAIGVGTLQYSVKDPAFGAVGDGTTDDTASIQSALNSAGTFAVFIPPGTYIVSGLTLPIPSPSIFGSGREVSILKLKSSVSADVIKTSGFAALTGTTNSGGNHNFFLKDFTIDGSSVSGSNGYGLRLYGCGFHIDNVRVRGCGQVGIYGEFSVSATDPNNNVPAYLHNVSAESNLSHGIQWKGPRSSLFDHCSAFYNGGNAFYLQTAQTGATLLTGCDAFFQDSTTRNGFVIESRAQLVNCKSYSGNTNSGDGFQFNIDSPIALGCFSDAPGGAGYHFLGNVSAAMALGCQVNDPVDSAVRFEGAARNCLVDVAMTGTAPAVNIVGFDQGFHMVRVTGGTSVISGTPNAFNIFHLTPQDGSTHALIRGNLLWRASAGSAVQPPIGFSSDNSLGWFSSGASAMDLSYGRLQSTAAHPDMVVLRRSGDTINTRFVSTSDGDSQWRVNADHNNASDDASKPSWSVRLGFPSVDDFVVYRSASAQTASYVTMLEMDSKGTLNIPQGGAVISGVVNLRGGALSLRTTASAGSSSALTQGEMCLVAVSTTSAQLAFRSGNTTYLFNANAASP